VWHPRGAHQTEVWRWYLVDNSAPEEIKHFLRDYYIRYSGLAGMTEQDDMENWNYAHAASRGVIARRYPYTYEQGLSKTMSATSYRSLAGLSTLPRRSRASTICATSIRAQFMEADSWDELMTWRRGARMHVAAK
jgi:hypothetical protein